MSDQRISILVIDDDPELTLTLGATLEAEGYGVLLANSGEQGLELAYTRRPHLVLLDVAMPGMDGNEVCRELQFGYTKDIPVVFLTAKTGLADMMEANRSGASAYITKPFRTPHLLETVRDVLRDASAYYDEITGLPTLAHAQVEVQRSMHEHSQLGILYVTVDSVHTLEQSQGFEVVDEMYRAIGRRLHESRGHLIRNEDFVSISSLGNAFLVILSPSRDKAFVGDDDLEEVKVRLKEQLLRNVEADLAANLLATVDLRVGCARLTQSPKVRFKRALMAAIDEATRGIERERDEVRHRLSLEFGRVVETGQISCVYQPIVNLHGFSVFGYELLARGPRQSELHRPDALFEVARAEARVPELDRICRMTAARGAADLPPHYLRFINAEPLNLFFHPDSDVFVREFVEATPVELRAQTVVEITENAVIDDFAHMREVVRSLRNSGFRIAIDDAGAGYAGLQTMVEIEPDFIKLDMSLTRGIESSIVKQKLVGTLRDFCRQACITLVAEGIETRAQLDALVALGIDFGQGFLFAHPGPPHPEITVCPPAANVVLTVGARPAAAQPALFPGAETAPGRA
jgi:EAL domain-containing protein (putative c-di-GMP-specific phosphodiesterase class I)/DNA-binding response OmpR family regulator